MTKKRKAIATLLLFLVIAFICSHKVSADDQGDNFDQYSHAQQELVFSAKENNIIDDFVFHHVLTEAYNRIGISIDLSLLPNERALRSSNSGVTDGEMARIEKVNKIYPFLIRVPVAIFMSKVSAFSLQRQELSGFWALTDKEVAIERGIKIIEQAAIDNRWQYYKVRSTTQLFDMLLRKYTEFAVVDELKALRILSTMEESKSRQVYLIQPPLHKVPLYHFLHKKHENLLPKITDSLKKMERQGLIKERMSELYQRYR